MLNRIIFAALLALGTAHAPAQTSAPVTSKYAIKVKQNCSAVTPETCEIAHALQRGINIGTSLEAPREGDWGVTIEQSYLDKSAELFSTVRLPVRWSNHAAPTADATLDEVFAARVDKIIDSLLAKGLYVILDVHHYNQLSGAKLHPNEFRVDPSVVETRFINIWKQLAQRYKNRSPKLLFEILNEPTGPLEGDVLNRLFSDSLKVIRASNPTRVVMIGPRENRIQLMDKLKIPADKNLILAFHLYDPHTFSHQGLAYLPQFPLGPVCCNAKAHNLVIDGMELAKKWNQKTGYPMHLGEFGSNDKADIKSREVYTRIVRDEAESRGFGWTFWEFTSGFGMYDAKTGQWIEPIRRALMD